MKAMQLNYASLACGEVRQGSILFYEGARGAMCADIVTKFERAPEGKYVLTLVDMDYNVYKLTIFPTFETDMYTTFKEAFGHLFDTIAYTDYVIDSAKQLSYIQDSEERYTLLREIEFVTRALLWRTNNDCNAK